MALMATQGVIILDKKHIYFDGFGHPHPIQWNGMRTHQFAWAAINDWQGSPQSTPVIHESIEVERHSIDVWLQSLGLTTQALRRLEARWLRDWGIDLKVLASDQFLRNEASYRPTRLGAVPPKDFSNSVTHFVDAWWIWEPGQPGRFPAFDRQLLRISLERAYRAKMNRRPKGSHYEAFVDRAVSQLGTAAIRDFLLRHDEPFDHPVFRLAESRGGSLNPLTVLCRALVFLRLASALGNRLIRNSHISSAQLSFWLDQLGSDSGLWEPGAPPDSLSDLWADVEDALADVRGSAVAGVPTSSLRVTWEEIPGPLRSISQFERVGMWALGL